MGVNSEHEDGDNAETRDSREQSQASDRSTESHRKIVTYQSRSRSRGRSHSRSPSEPKAKKKSRSRSRSRSNRRSRKSKYRSRSRSPRKYSRASRHSRSRSYSRSRSGSASPYRRRGRTHSRSPMSNRRRHTSSRVSDNPHPNRCLGVFGLSLYTTEQQLHQIFSKYGRVERVQVIIDAKTGRSRGFCFVYYEHLEDARNAKEQCTGMEIGGRKIRVDYSITERAHTPTPGIYMGKPTYSDDRYSSRRRDRYDDDYYGGGSYRGRYRSPSPYYSRSRRARYERSRSRSYSPRRY